MVLKMCCKEGNSGRIGLESFVALHPGRFESVWTVMPSGITLDSMNLFK